MKPKRTARVEVRSKHSRGVGPRRFGGPDTYVAVQVVPERVEPLRRLDRKAAARRGIELIYVGEGYAKHFGPRSTLGEAIRKATEIVDRINAEEGTGETKSVHWGIQSAKLWRLRFGLAKR